MRKYFLVTITVVHGVVYSQHPFRHWSEAVEVRYDSRQPLVDYTLSIDSTDTSSYQVEMVVRNVPDTFHVAMMTHPEYDDRYWRFLQDFYVTSTNGQGSIIREDSALWRIAVKGNEATLHYRIRFPVLQDPPRSSWKAFLSSTGGLVGGPHSFMYVVGATLCPSYVTLRIPSTWKIVTGLHSTFHPNVFFAPSVFLLMDDPIFVGEFKTWTFEVNSVPHRVVYWPLLSAAKFDSTKLLSAMQKLVQQASLLFGRLPYREYSFMLQDGAVGSLEHNNSVTVGAPSLQLGENMESTISEVAHEYFHTWNLLRIRPIEYGDVSYKTPPLSKGLWFSEGLTMFYADLLRRRAALPVFDSSRVKHIERLIRRYLSSPAYLKFSAEEISRASYGPAGMLGDYSGSTHLQGELLGTLLDLIIRDVSNGEYSMDDVMREMLRKFSGEKGFTTADIEQVAHQVCRCNIHSFFLDHVYGHKQIDFNKYLALIGLTIKVQWKDVRSADNQPAPDLRVYAWQAPGEYIVRIGITDPTSIWGKAGLHTGDILRFVNGTKIESARNFRQIIRQAKAGDTVDLKMERPSGMFSTKVLITGYQQPEVRIVELEQISEKQKRIFTQWNNQ